MVVGSILWFSATVTAFKALNQISASKFSIIESLSPLLSIILAFFFLGESLTQSQIIGTVLILVAVFMTVYDKNSNFGHFSQGELIALLSISLSGLALVNDKGIYQVTPLSPTLATMFILPGIIGMIYKPEELKKFHLVKKSRTAIKELLIMSAIWGAAAIAYYKAVVISNSLELL